MSKKKVTWHIGVNKTGSTALESFCVNQHEWLKKQGISFFSKALFYQHFWGLYYDDAFSETQLSYLRQLFTHMVNKELASDHVVLIDEDISLRNPFFEGFLVRYQSTFGTFHNRIETMAKRIKQLTQDVDLQLVLYVRRQDLFLESLYAHTIKTRHFFHLPFHRFKEIYGVKQLDWHRIAMIMANEVGKERVQVRVYDRENFVNQHIVSDFLDVLGCDPIESSHLETDVNSRLDYEHFEAVRAFNQIELPLNPKYYFRTCPSAYCQSKTSYGFLSQTEREQCLSQFEAANQALSEDFFDNKPVFSNEISDKPCLDQSKELLLTDQQVTTYKESFYKPEYFLSPS